MKNTILGKVLTVVAVALIVTVTTGGVAIAGSEINEKARLELNSTGILRHFEGDAKLQLHIKELPDSATTIGSRTMRPGVGKKIGPQSDEEEDEERRLREEEEEQAVG